MIDEREQAEFEQGFFDIIDRDLLSRGVSVCGLYEGELTAIRCYYAHAVLRAIDAGKAGASFEETLDSILLNRGEVIT